MVLAIKNILFITFISFVFFSCEKSSEQKAPNILFISIDDLRTELGVYGNKIIKTPNLDQLASEGTAFSNHFVQVPTCGASRHSLLTGLRPRTKAQLKNSVIVTETSTKPEGIIPESFIHHLKRNGYYTVGIGKISHSADGLVYGYEEQPSNKRELPYSWDELHFDAGKWETGWNSFFAYADGENRQSMKRQVKPYEAGNVDDDGYPDGLTTKLAVSKLKDLKNKSQPFFLGVGFFKPHLPFNAPKKYWNLYKREEIPISDNSKIPQNISLSSLHNSGEFNGYQLGEEMAGLNQPVSNDYARKITHAYYAAVSYIDAQVGVLIEEVRNLGLENNTVIIVWGDHGWHLGDQQVWGKHTLFENALNSALIIKIPGKKPSKNVNKTIVETVDIYPTILELSNIKAPYQLDGSSLIPLINKYETKKVAYSYFRDGISLRTSRYRLTKYFRKQQPTIELYDHLNDSLETKNIAQENPELVNKLMPLLELGNTGLYN
ncbi:sulfatase [Flavicella sp.]|uniref:sulfatase n=1 Tax=Flavicella sp. TaxID=2957742 RepID=UPI00301A1912